jgi:serine protease Do
VKRASSLAVLGAVVLTAPVFLTSDLLTSNLLAQTPAPTPAPVKPAPASLGDFSASLEALAARVRPAVVQIFSTGYATPEEGGGSTKTDSLLSRQTSTGSGVILSADGYIVTNNHLVEGARKLEVKLPTRGNQRLTLPAKVVGVDRETDLAVIKIDRATLPVLRLGNSDQLKQGQLVMAFGNPLGLEGSVSMGIVSSTGRQIKPDDPLSYIQTDAPINPGNSGGPLVDTEGRVVGINTFIYTQSGGSEGIGFAVPSTVVRMIYDQIRKDGHVHRGHIGVSVQTVTPVLAKGLGLGQDWGVLVSDLEPDGGAEKAGLKAGDIIETLDGKQMQNASQLENAVYRLARAGSVDLTVMRDARTLKMTVPVHDREDDPQRFADMVNPEDNLVPKLGILVIELNEKLTAMLPDLRHEYGLVVGARAMVAPYSGGALEAGDVIYEINHTPTSTVKALRSELDALKPGDAVVLQIERSGRLMYLPIELE